MKRSIFVLFACLFLTNLATGQSKTPQANCSTYDWYLWSVSSSACTPSYLTATTYTQAYDFSGYCYNTQNPAPHYNNFTWTGTTSPNPAVATGQCKEFIAFNSLNCPTSYYVNVVPAPQITSTDYVNRIYLYLYNGLVPTSSIGGSCTSSPGPTNFFQCIAQACTQPRSCPVLIDTTGEGFIGHLTGWEDGVNFDIDGTGTPVKMGWTAKGSGLAFLALPDAEGNVRNGLQFFGDHTPQPPSDQPDGFKALAVYDQNKDGKIDPQDPIWPSLVGCIDANHNGIFEKGECVPLDQLGVHSISLDEHRSPKVDPWGNQLRKWVNIDERADHTAYDVWFVLCPN